MHDDFFQGTGPGAPSFKFDQIGDTVWGEIVDISKSQSTVYNSNPPVGERNDDGSPRMQLRIILQTELRGWAGVSKIPTNDQGQQKSPQEDDGKRAVFIKEHSNLQFRFGDALVAAGQNGQRAALETGALLSVKFAATRPSSQGNDAKQFEVHYRPAPPKNPSEGFFPTQQHGQAPQGIQQGQPGGQVGYAAQGYQQQQAPQQPQYAPPAQQPQGPPPGAQQPWAQGAPAQPQYAQQGPPQQPQGPPPSQDPWAQPQGQQGPPPSQDPWAQAGPANQQYGDQPPY